MKEIVVKVALVLAVLGLAACGAAAEGETGATMSAAPDPQDAASEVVLTNEMELMLGTLKLDEVDLAPDAAQAAGLLTLWQAYQSLATSDTAASQELDAVLGQIEETMAEEQLAAIAAMDLDQDDLAVFMDAYREEAAASGESPAGGSFGRGVGGPGGDFIPPEGGFAQSPAGFGPRDGSGGGGFAPPTGEDIGGLNPEMQATAQASRSAGIGNRGALFLLQPLIAELQSLAGG